MNTSTGVEKLIAIQSRHAWIYNGTGWDLAPDASAGRYFASTTAKVEHAEFLDYTFLVDGSTVPRSYNGSTWSYTTNLEGAPIGRFIKLFGNRLYIANIKIQVPGVSGGVISFPSRVWFSDIPEQDDEGNWRITWNYQSGNDLITTAGTSTVTSPSANFVSRNIRAGDPFYIVTGSNIKKYTVAGVTSETALKLTTNVTNSSTGQSYWVGGNWFDVKANDSDVIEGLNESSNRLLILKGESAHRWNEESLEQIKGIPGTKSNRSIINLGAFTYWHHHTGIIRYNGVTGELISEPIWDIIQGISSSNYNDIVAWTDNAHFVKFFVGDVTANLQTDLPAISKCAVVHDVTQETWATQSLAHTLTCFVPWVESSSPELYAGASDGQVYQLETGTDYDGAAISTRLRTKVYYPVAPEVTVTGERIEEYSDRGDNLQITYRRVRQPSQRDADFKPISKAFPIAESDFRGIQFEAVESSTKDSFILEQLTVFFNKPRIEE